VGYFPFVSTGGGSSITTPVSVPNGGTGTASLASYAVITGGTTSTNQVQQVSGLGTSNFALLSAGAAAVPVWAAPAAPVSPLTDAATITVNAALGTLLTVTLGGSRTMRAPSNPVNGQPLIFQLTQDGTGSRTITWTSGPGGYTFGAGAAPTLSTAINTTDLVGFRYSAVVGKWCFQGSQLGFS